MRIALDRPRGLRFIAAAAAAALLLSWISISHIRHGFTPGWASTSSGISSHRALPLRSAATVREGSSQIAPVVQDAKQIAADQLAAIGMPLTPEGLVRCA